MRKHRRHNEDDTEVDMTPMLDIVFIMLIFFIVTTSFVRESGVDLERPSNNPNTPKDKPVMPIVIKIDDLNSIFVNKLEVDFRSVEGAIEAEKAKNPKAAVIVSASPESNTDTLIQVFNSAKEAGIDKINVATAAVTTR